MLKNVALVLVAVCLLFSCETENESDGASSNLDVVNLNTANGSFNSPFWVFAMDWRFGRTCGPGGGVCFTDADGDIITFCDLVAPPDDDLDPIGQVFDIMVASDVSSPDNGFIGLQRYDDELRIAFSRDLGERSLRIDENMVITDEISRKLGVKEITVKAGNYRLDYTNLEHGETVVPIRVREIELDRHDVYGEINSRDYPVGGGLTAEAFMEDLGVTPDDLEEYQVIEGKFTGTAYAEHRVNGEIIYVWHKYEDEPVFLFEGKLRDGGRVSMSRISWCGNEFGGWNTFDFFWAFIDNGCWWCEN